LIRAEKAEEEEEETFFVHTICIKKTVTSQVAKFIKLFLQCHLRFVAFNINIIMIVIYSRRKL
jgi:hypothetical protein